MNAVAWIGTVAGAGEVRADAHVSVHDRGLLLGEGLFETMRAVAGDAGVRLPLVALHLERLAEGARRFGWRAPEAETVERAARELCAASGMEDGVVRLTLTGGAGAPAMVLTARERVVRTDPLRLVVVTARRDPSDPTAELKTTSRAFWTLAQREAEAAGADEALVLSARGTLAETTTGNVFLRTGGRLCTPARDGTFLPGVARRVLLEELGASIDERAIAAGELSRAEGVWVTNAVHGARRARVLPAGPAAPADDPLGAVFDARLA